MSGLMALLIRWYTFTGETLGEIAGLFRDSFLFRAVTSGSTFAAMAAMTVTVNETGSEFVQGFLQHAYREAPPAITFAVEAVDLLTPVFDWPIFFYCLSISMWAICYGLVIKFTRWLYSLVPVLQ